MVNLYLSQVLQNVTILSAQLPPQNYLPILSGKGQKAYLYHKWEEKREKGDRERSTGSN